MIKCSMCKSKAIGHGGSYMSHPLCVPCFYRMERLYKSSDHPNYQDFLSLIKSLGSYKRCIGSWINEN